MIKRNRLWTLMLALIMLVGMMPTVTYAAKWAPSETPPEFTQIIFKSIGEGADDFTGTFSIEDSEDAEHGKVIKMGNAGSANLIKTFEKEKQDGAKFVSDNGQFMISFDILANQTNNFIMLRLLDSNDVHVAPFAMNGFGKMYYCNGEGLPSATTSYNWEMDYSANTWYNIKILMNCEQTYADYYVNDKYWGRSDFRSGYIFNNRIYDGVMPKQMYFQFAPWNAISDGVVTPDGNGSFLLDNITYGLVDTRDKSDVAFVKSEVGNIYDEQAVNIQCDITNKNDADMQYTLVCDIRTDKNKSVKQASEKYDVKAGESRRITLLNKADEKGFYTAEVKLLNDKGELLSKDTTRFSVVMHHEKLNSTLGVCSHTIGQYSVRSGATEDMLDVSEKLGFSYVRDGVVSYFAYDPYWNKLNEFPEKSWRFMTPMKNSNLGLMATLGEGAMITNLYPPAKEEDLTDDVLKSWSDMCYTLVNEIKDVTNDIEVINEYWLTQQGDLLEMNARTYAKYLKASTEPIRKANPNANIIAMCGSARASLTKWMEYIIIALGDNPGQYFDTIAVHDYMLGYGAIYPEQGINDDIPALMEMLKKYGLEDKAVWNTEFGITSGYTKCDIDEKTKGDYHIRQAMLQNMYYGKSTVYQLSQNYGGGLSEYEDGFGVVRKPESGEIWYEALPTALEVAAYNAIFADSKFISRQVIEDSNPASITADDVWCYKYKLADGKECFAIYSVENEKDASIKFGADEVTVYDEYGNKTEMSAIDGYTTIKLSKAPTYIVADKLADSIELRDKPLFTVPGEIAMPLDDEYSFSVGNSANVGANVTVDATVNSEIISTTPFNKGQSNVTLCSYNDSRSVENYKFYNKDNIEELSVKIADGGKVYYKEPIRVKYVSALQSDIKIMPYRSGRWQAILSLKNNKRTSPLSGRIELSTGDSDEIKNLLSGEESKFRFNIPEGILSKEYTVDATMILDDGSTVTDSATTNFVSVERADAAPTIDGKIDRGEWKTSGQSIKFDTAEQWKSTEKKSDRKWGGKSDLSGDMYIMYDDTYFYLAAEITDDIHCGSDEKDRVYCMDSIQFCIADTKTSASPYTEMGIALNDNGESMITRYHHFRQGTPFYVASELNKFNDTEIKITRNEDEHKTVYELKMPWTEFFEDGKPQTSNLVFSALVNENDAKGRVAYMEWASGVGNVKNPAEFAEVPFN